MALKKKSHPAPNHYLKARDWKIESHKAQDNRQKFLKEERISETDKILK